MIGVRGGRPVDRERAFEWAEKEIVSKRSAARVWRSVAADPTTLPSSKVAAAQKAEWFDEEADALELILGFAKAANEAVGGRTPEGKA